MRNLTISILITLLIIASGMVSVAHSQNLAVSKLALMTFEGKMEIKASPAQVWAALTDADKAQSWCPYWKTAKATQPLTAVGRTIEYMDSWGNGGKSVVIYAEQAKELRVAHVPNDGSYVCQVKFILEPKGNTTVVSVTDQYSDKLEVPVDKDTAAQVKQEITKYMAALKTLVEKSASMTSKK